jgi:hypothetical protein
MNTSSAARQTTARPRPNPLAFYFDPVPDIVRLDIARGKLTELDGLVMARCLRQRGASGCAPGSACTKEKIAAAPRDDEAGNLLDQGGLGKHPRTIQRSFARLKQCGHMKHVPDLSDRTGYRLEFPSLTPIRLAAGTEASLPGRPTRPTGGDSRVSPPQPHSTYARSETQTQDTTDEFARRAAEPESSSSSFSNLGQENPEQTARKPMDPATVDTALLAATITAGIVAKLLTRFEAKMAAAPDRSEVEAWVAEHGVELVQVAAEMIERGKLRLRRGVLKFLTTHHGRDPDWVRSDAGLPPQKTTAPPMQNYNPPAREETPGEPETREELEEAIARLDQAEANCRRLEWWELDLRETTRAKMAALNAGEREGGAR